MVEQGELTDWETVSVVNETVADSIVIVKGHTPTRPVTVKLVPLPTGVEKWDYWPVEVTAYRLGDEQSEVVTPFEASGQLSDLSGGTGKIELIGATKRAYIPSKT
jgi:hypothetical protein